MDTLGYKNPVFFLFALSIAAEAWIIIRWHRSTFPWKESLVSLFIALGGRGASAVSAIPIWFTATWIYEHRIASFDLTHWYEWVILFVGHEFCYYWHHRAAHRCRWVWATHRVHHTPEHLTFSGAYRLAWTSLLSGIFLFFMPLVWLGFPPMAVFELFTASLVYQFWLHTDLIPKLGALEWLLNTPSNHRVHHAINPEYINANYGGVLMIFDHWFGTYQPERDDLPCRYGVLGEAASHNPFKVLFDEWIRIVRDLLGEGALGSKVMLAFGPPGGIADRFHADARQPSLRSVTEQVPRSIE